MRAMHRLCILALFLLTTSASAQTPRIDPAGILGSVLISPRAGGTDAALEKFIELAGGAKAKLAILHFDDAPAAVVERLTAAAKKKDAAEPKLIALKDAKAELPKVSGVWVVGASMQRVHDTYREFPLLSPLAGVLKRSGVVAVAGHPTAGLLGVIPLDVVDLGLFPRTKRKKEIDLKGCVAFNVGVDGTLLIRGRTLSAVGPGSIELSLWATKTLPPRTITLSGKGQEDLTALRRAAYDRANDFPPAKPEQPFVDKGTLVIVGGGGSPDGLYKKFIEYAGGPEKANIVIFPTAAEPIVKRDIIALNFKKAGAKKATVLYGKTLAEVESKEFLDTLKEATGLWFDGGRQWRFVDCYENTKALPLMFDVLKRGGVIGGTSAGATIQGDYLARGGVFNNFDIRYEGYERGLGFLKGVAIDQHFTQRKRQADMTQLMKIHPQYLGIGIDEATALVVQKSIGEVIGKGKVHFYDTNRKFEKGQPDHEALAAGGRYDLKARKVIAP